MGAVRATGILGPTFITCSVAAIATLAACKLRCLSTTQAAVVAVHSSPAQLWPQWDRFEIKAKSSFGGGQCLVSTQGGKRSAPITPTSHTYSFHETEPFVFPLSARVADREPPPTTKTDIVTASLSRSPCWFGKGNSDESWLPICVRYRVYQRHGDLADAPMISLENGTQLQLRTQPTFPPFLRVGRFVVRVSCLQCYLTEDQNREAVPQPQRGVLSLLPA
ncbi:hypothetical protein SODALDRAFT_358111 [Sodiomyces alkalinus F11]|uniref:Uncharacterized protein n=1 Tax=Sodiomyces alkalinus (strain CBS 110278 / VKM F-3762 / F11) TaxID=1314773 RepID=A0A3N2PYU6_SODAK|nr:hypothetical protein SODALDRAFT_358111 [Sodiomyces alkalinus F11]ROT39699.1 hypothetical protein SODALDRAFT_358111 [Sodiomyces alkalinus F11]